MSVAARRRGAADWTGAGHLYGTAGLVVLITAFYVVTAPANHALAIDPYYYAELIERSPLDGVPHPRAMLWILAMQGLYQAAALFVPDPDPFLIARLANAVVTALAVLLLARILEHDLGVSRVAAGLTAALFGVSYGIWRYATEIEVYAPAGLASLLIVQAAFAMDRPTTGSPAGRTARLAALGAFGTLLYQPLGFLPALAVPAYLAARGQVRQLPLYYLVSGVLVLAGFGGAYLLGQRGPERDAVAFVFQTGELHPSILTLEGVARMAYAVGSNLLSTHWVFGHEALRRVMAASADNYEIYAAVRAGWLVWVPAVTLPAALVLTLTLAPPALRWRPDPGHRAKLGAVALWLLLHAAMKLILAPGGFEGWIPALVPLSILIGVVVVGPAVAAGCSGLVAALLVVMLAHNLLAGLGILRSPAGDYLIARGDPVLARTGPGDLILVPTHWSLQSYLEYKGEARTLRVDPADPEAARPAIAETLAAGGRVVALDDVASLLEAGDLAGAQRFATADAGGAYLLAPAPARP